MILRDTDLLKEWLIPRLSPICHTDPKALADYIIGLIKKDKPVRTLKSICIEELQVFLMRETVPLVDRLFEVLEGELYLAKGTRSQETELREKSHASVRTPDRLKTRLESRTKSEPDMDAQGRVKRMKEGLGPNSKRSVGEVMHGHASLRMKEKTRGIWKSHDSIKPNPTSTKQFYITDDEATDEYAVCDDARGESEDESPIFEETNKPGRCKDYDEKGYCLLGESCPYDHGSDPVVLEPAYNPTHPPIQVPLPMPLIAPTIIPINPSDPRLILPPTVTQLPISAPAGLTVSRPISATDGYNPENPAYDSVDGDNIVPISGAHGIPPPVDLDTKPIQSQAKYINNMNSVNSGDSVHMTTISNGGIKKYPHINQLSTALILRKVPVELNSVAKLSNYFDKFGTVVNVQVRYDNDPEGALIRFVTPQEAKKAHDCSDAVLGNRFIRVFYSKRDRNTSYPPKQKPFEITSPIELATIAVTGPIQTLPADTESDKEQLSPEDLETPTTILSESLSLSNISADHTKPVIMPKVKVPAIDPKMIEKRLEIQKRKQELLDQFLTQQKLLFGMLSKSSSLIEKERIKTQMKEINEKMDNFRTSTEQVEALRTETARMVTHSAKEKKKQELRQNGDLARAVRVPHKDLRGIISRKPRSLLILSIKPTEKDELMTYLERFGIIEQVNFKPDESQLLVTYRSRQEAEKLVHSTYPFKGRNLIMKWSAPKKPLRSQLKYVNARAHVKPGFVRFSRPGIVDIAGERGLETQRDLLTPDFNIAFGTEQALLLEETNNNIESNEDPIPDDGFGSIGSPSEIDYFNFLEPKVPMCDDSENDEEEEVYWRRRDKV